MYFIKEITKDFWEIKKGGNVYLVDFAKKICTCPSFKYNPNKERFR